MVQMRDVDVDGEGFRLRPISKAIRRWICYDSSLMRRDECVEYALKGIGYVLDCDDTGPEQPPYHEYCGILYPGWHTTS